jgi:hypothetical protein
MLGYLVSDAASVSTALGPAAPGASRVARPSRPVAPKAPASSAGLTATKSTAIEPAVARLRACVGVSGSWQGHRVHPGIEAATGVN